MKNYYLLTLVLVAILGFVRCSNDDSPEEYTPVSPVVMDLTAVPYPKLSDYKFFDGELKLQNPSYKVLPYKPASELFSDYAHKKRFVWMPLGSKATYDGDDNILDFPVGAALIKTFYYENVLPAGNTKIIETRLLIKKRESSYNVPGQADDSGWETYNYLWNDDQTEAYLDIDGYGAVVSVDWLENGVAKHTDYKVPATIECQTCHKLNPNHSALGEVVIPIGPKPQNLNFVYSYGNIQQNQLQKWIAEGYLESVPANINSTVNWKDASQPLELRARSYIDMNCAHCHRDGAHCDYTPMRFNFSNNDMYLFGVCMEPTQGIPDKPYVIRAGDPDRSEMIHRMTSNDQSVMMPIIGRTLVHEEGVALMSQYISSLTTPCD